MKEIVSTITSKGQITLPKDVREQLGVSTHDKVVFVIDDDGTITLQVSPYPSVASLTGAAGSLDAPLSWEEMRTIAREDHLQGKARKDAQP